MKLGRNSTLTIVLVLFTWILVSCHTQKHTTETDKEEKNVSSEKNQKLESIYAERLGVKPSEIRNNNLYAFIDNWYGVPYQYGGKSKKGIDCSGFVATLYKEVYKKDISGSSESIYEKCSTVSAKDLKEGDLVFFKIDQNRISHIGVYLQNNKFVHASTKKGVMIDDLNEPYYKKYFYKGGKLK